MERVVWSELSDNEQRRVLARPSGRADPALMDSVREIVEDVAARGWEAVEAHSNRIDNQEPRLIAVAPLAANARIELGSGFVAALELAKANIERFQQAAKPQDVTVEIMPGLTVAKLWRPLDHVGVYVPGGSASLFSTLLMLAIPAGVAGVTKLTVVTPPRPGGLDPAVALAAEICGINEIWTVGGAQAIAALAFGAGGIERADLICGPGNAWVAAAKALVSSLPGGPRIDLPAGPSELMVIADGFADPKLVAADLLSQAEHDPSAQVLLVTSSLPLAGAVEEEVKRQLASLPRAQIARAALAHARVIIINDMDQAMMIANNYAPEHLSLACLESSPLVQKVHNAGAIFAGRFAAEAFGDYVSGSSHVLPTDGAARAWGGVSTATFMKAITVQEVSPDAASLLAAPAATLARAEGLEAHARAAALRMEHAA